MNRRAFFTRTLGAFAAVVAAPLLSAAKPVVDWGTGPDFTVLTYKGVPLVFDQAVPSNRIVFVNPRWPEWREDAQQCIVGTVDVTQSNFAGFAEQNTP